jgi:hypothetical protein
MTNKNTLLVSEDLNKIVGSIACIGTHPHTVEEARDLFQDGLRLVNEAERNNPVVKRLAEDLEQLDVRRDPMEDVTWEEVALGLWKKGLRYR